MQRSVVLAVVVSFLAVAAAATLILLPEEKVVPQGGEGIDSTIPVEGYVTVSVSRQGTEIYYYEGHNLITDAGKDFISAQIGSTSTGSNGANYIALSSDDTAPVATDTTLTGEITGSGLDRAQGTYTHSAGTNTFTVEAVFTASATVSDVQKTGLFTASSGGTMMAENTFSSVNLISGDQLTLTWTITIGQ
ncbi:hypothetical protein [Nitrososphaera sp.]|uniref:hypothetical protein n=1 Tax=Nitrososphaera sp. TaxID=1971748 RepID=UPI002EDA4A6D